MIRWLTYRPLYAPVLALILCACLSACFPERDRGAEIQALVEQTVADRVVSYQQVRKKRCLEEVLEEANLRVDSILIQEATLQSGSAFKPNRPNRPSQPNIRRLKDTLPVRPLLPTDTLPPPDTIQDGGS